MGWVVSITPWPRFTPGERTPGTHCTGGWVGPRAGLDTEARGKILCPCQGSNPDRPVVQPVVRHYTAWANEFKKNVVYPNTCNSESLIRYISRINYLFHMACVQTTDAIQQPYQLLFLQNKCRKGTTCNKDVSSRWVVSFCDESLKILSDALTLFCHCFNDNVSQILILTIQPIHKPWLINDTVFLHTLSC
jgi:hypothetical protein